MHKFWRASSRDFREVSRVTLLENFSKYMNLKVFILIKT